MSLPVEIDELPPTIPYGKVVARVLHASVDIAADSGDKPQAAPATGTVTVTPAASLLSAPFALVTQRAQVLPLDADGFISDQGGHPFVWLPAGQWTFSFDLDPVDGVTLTIAPITVEVTEQHTNVAPLDLALSANYTAPDGALVQVLLVPTNPIPGQSLVAGPVGGLVWSDRAVPGENVGYELPPAGIPEDDLELAVQGKINSPVDQVARDAVASGLASRALAVHGHTASQVTDLAAFVGTGTGTLSVASYGAVGDGIVNDTTALTSAVAAAKVQGKALHWPAGVYLTTASITDLHNVRHVGSGSISRSGTTFYPAPTGSRANTIHVIPSGTSGDGITAGTAVVGFQAAFDIIDKYGPYVPGLWTVLAAAGTYPQATAATLSATSVNRVVVRGPAAGHPNVPTAVIDGAGGIAYAHGLRANGLGVAVEFRDLKFINFTAGAGDTTRIGCVGENEADVYFVNVHATGASWCGAYATSTVHARVAGGIFDGCRSGFIANDTACTVGYLTPSIFRNNTQSGVYWSRGSQGHVDFCAFEDNAVGLDVDTNARVDAVGNNFKRNNVARRTTSGGIISEGGTLDIFNVGTADANTQDNVYGAFSGAGSELFTGQSYFRVAYDRTLRTLTGTTTITTMATPYTIPARRLAGTAKQLRVQVHGVYTVTAGSVMTVSFGGMDIVFTVPGAGTSLSFELDVTLFEVSGGYRALGRLMQGLSQARASTATAGFSKDIDQAVLIKATPAATSDTINIYRTDVWVMG